MEPSAPQSLSIPDSSTGAGASFGSICVTSAEAINSLLRTLIAETVTVFEWDLLVALMTVRFAAEDRALTAGGSDGDHARCHAREHSQMLAFAQDMRLDVRRGRPVSTRTLAIFSDWWHTHSTVWDPVDFRAHNVAQSPLRARYPVLGGQGSDDQT
ncbi:MAG: hypothetical protein SF002_12470 [Alphaproteobacteria bacterium]|nr:hypothetical protein [Alphaproteobacteria bacterium]